MYLRTVCLKIFKNRTFSDVRDPLLPSRHILAVSHPKCLSRSFRNGIKMPERFFRFFWKRTEVSKTLIVGQLGPPDYSGMWLLVWLLKHAPITDLQKPPLRRSVFMFPSTTLTPREGKIDLS